MEDEQLKELIVEKDVSVKVKSTCLLSTEKKVATIK